MYLQGEGDFVLTDTATGLEHRVPITPGKLISWPNAGFTHRVESGASRIRRRMLGPMAFDPLSNSLVGVGGTPMPMPCPLLYGYECVDPQPVNSVFPHLTGADCGEAWCVGRFHVHRDGMVCGLCGVKARVRTEVPNRFTSLLLFCLSCGRQLLHAGGLRVQPVGLPDRSVRVHGHFLHCIRGGPRLPVPLHRRE